MFQHTARKPSGHILTTGPLGDLTADTQMCVHCGFHWVVKPGSGTVRGFCRKCMGLTCGAAKCHDCMPVEQRLDLYEAGKIETL